MSGQIITGKALEKLATLPAQSVGMCLTDLPYESTANDWDKRIPIEPMWLQLERVMKPNSAILLFAADSSNNPYLSELVISRRKNFRFKYTWKKNRVANPHNVHIMPLRNVEEIAVFSFGKLPYFPQKTTGHKPSNSAVKKANSTKVYQQNKETFYAGGNTTRYPKTLLEFDCVDNNSPVRVHENQKPVDLLQHLIRQHSRAGEIILDFCCGSGSTGIAAYLEKRDYILIDKDEKWTAHARNWLAKLKGEPVDIPINISKGSMPLFQTNF